MNGGYWLQQLLNGLMLACLYSTLAVAYALLQGITNRIVLSFGDVASFGAFAAINAAYWALLDGEDSSAVLAVGLLAALVVAAVLGRVTHDFIFRPIIGLPNQAVMIASIGLSILLQEVMRFASDGRDLWLPPLFDNRLTLLGGTPGVTIGAPQLAVVSVSAALIAGLFLTMRLTRAGRLWRAVAQNERLARLSGVDTARVFQWTFIAASAIAAVAGWMVTASYGGVSFGMGLVLGFKAMFAAIIGGFGRLEGAVIGGVFLALVETAWTASLPMNYRDVAVFGLIIAMLVLKPEGLLGTPARADSEV